MRRARIPSDRKLARSKDLRTLRLVEVVWRDACGDGRWAVLTESRKRTVAMVKTLGYLTKNTRQELQVVQSINDLGDVSGSMTIPSQCVITVSCLSRLDQTR